MKQKLVVLGLAGVLLFSGISVFAAENGCGHPAFTTYYGTEIGVENCKQHTRCEIYTTYGVTAITCHNCFESVVVRREAISKKHIGQGY